MLRKDGELWGNCSFDFPRVRVSPLITYEQMTYTMSSFFTPDYNLLFLLYLHYFLAILFRL